MKATRTIELADWMERYHECATELQREEWIGMSPGGVAGQLGVPRGTVHQWVHRGHLSLVEIVDERGGFVGQYIPDAEVRRFLEARGTTLREVASGRYRHPQARKSA